jgi:hypothetical protein
VSKPARIATTGTATPTPIATAWDFGLEVGAGGDGDGLGVVTGVVEGVLGVVGVDVGIGVVEITEVIVGFAKGGTPAIVGILAAPASTSTILLALVFHTD